MPSKKNNKITTSNNCLVIVVALGSPTKIDVKSIKDFLRVFLSDRRVVDLPRVLWYPILYGIILPLRSKKLLHKYQQTAINNQSALVYHANDQIKQLAKHNPGIDIQLAYSYVDPSVAQVLDNYYADNQTYPQSILILPTFPQFSSSTVLPVFDQLTMYFKPKSILPSVKFISSFATHPQYIAKIVQSIRNSWSVDGKSDVLLLSFHSIPVKMVASGDSYYAECYATYELIRQELELTVDICKISFQSKFGGAKWLEPSTLDTVNQLTQEKVKHLSVICPGFMQDCLETLEEINIELRDKFMGNGGEKFTYIPCLNATDDGISVLNQIIQNNL